MRGTAATRIIVFLVGMGVSAAVHLAMIERAGEIYVNRTAPAVLVLDRLGIDHGLDQYRLMVVAAVLILASFLAFERWRSPLWYSFVVGAASVNVSMSFLVGGGIDYIPLPITGVYTNAPDIFAFFGVAASVVHIAMRWYANQRRIRQWGG